MTDKVEVFLIFCEDYRLDDGGKPMMIGVLSPVFYTSPNPGLSDQIYLVTAVNVPHGVQKVALKLVVQLRHPDAEESPATFRSVLQRPDDMSPNEPWAAFLQLPIPIDEWKDGTVITGLLEANGASAHAYLECRMQERAEAKPVARRKARAKAKSARTKA